MSPQRMNHTDLQDATVKLLGMTGWSHLHVRRSVGRGSQHTTTTNVRGWPDLWAWSPRQPGRFLALEVKCPPDWLSDDQAAVLASLASSGVECFVLVEQLGRGTDKPTAPGVDVIDLFEGLPRLLRPRPSTRLPDIADYPREAPQAAPERNPA